MKYIYILFLFIVILVNVCSSQNLSEVFKSDLSEYIFKNESLQKTISDLLKKDSGVNPDILFYRISYLNNIYSKKITNNNLNGLSLLKHELEQATRERNNWLNDQINILKEKYHSNVFFYSAKSFLEDLIVEASIDTFSQAYSIDTNKVNYFVHKYYRKAPVLKYSDSVDYSILRQEYEEKEKEKLVELLKCIKVKSIDCVDIESDIFPYWPLFQKNPEDLNFVEFVIYNYENEYSLRGKNTYEYNLGLHLTSSFINRKLMYEYPGLPKQKIGEIKYFESAFLSLTYRQFIKEYLLAFSYVDFTLIYSFGFNSIKTIGNNQFTIINFFGGDLTKPYTVEQTYLGNFKLDKTLYHEFAFNASTPVFFITPELFIEAGVITGINLLNYEVNYKSYSETRYVEPGIYSPNTKILKRVEIPSNTYSKSELKFFINPELDIKTTIINPLILQLSLRFEYLSLYLGVTL